MEKVEHTIVQYAHGERWPNGLKSAAEAAEELGLTEERLLELAEAGFAPHWRIDGGPPQFRIQELKSWGARNLAAACTGREMNVTLNIRLEPTPENSAPEAIRDIPELMELHGGAEPGVYFLVKGEEVVYVGQSISPLNRIGTHTANRGKSFDRVFIVPVPCELLDKVEGAMIRWLNPPLNRGISPRRVQPGDDEQVIEYVYRHRRTKPRIAEVAA
jgi:hypothetical protein